MTPAGQKFLRWARPKERSYAILILTRKIDQSIVIDGDIKISVLGVERDRVKIGIEAPANVSVLREELLDASQKEALNQAKTIRKA